VPVELAASKRRNIASFFKPDLFQTQLGPFSIGARESQMPFDRHVAYRRTQAGTEMTLSLSTSKPVTKQSKPLPSGNLIAIPAGGEVKPLKMDRKGPEMVRDGASAIVITSGGIFSLFGH
jgi:hypothetical protein